MPAWSQVSRNRTIRGKEALRGPGRLESLHPSLPLAGGLVGILRAVVQIPVLPKPRHNYLSASGE